MTNPDFNLFARSLAVEIIDALKAQINLLTQMQPRLLTIEQAATYLGRSQKEIKRLVDAEEIHAVRSGTVTHIDRHDLDSWIEANKV